MTDWQEVARQKESLYLEAEEDGAAARKMLAEVRLLVSQMVTEFVANIPLGGPDPAYDPHDEFKRCAIDRAERAKRWAEKIIEAAS